MLGVTGIADDVLAKGDDETGHDVTFLSLLETAQSNNLKFNPNKIQFKMKECRLSAAIYPRRHKDHSEES